MGKSPGKIGLVKCKYLYYNIAGIELTNPAFNIVDYMLINIAFNGKYGALAQLGAHHTGSVGVRGSSPLCSTKILSKEVDC